MYVWRDAGIIPICTARRRVHHMEVNITATLDIHITSSIDIREGNVWRLLVSVEPLAVTLSPAQFIQRQCRPTRRNQP